MTRSRIAVVATVLLLVVSTGAVAADAPAQSVAATEAQALQTHSGSLDPGQTAASQTESCSFPVEVTDATGQTVTIEEEPERVVAIGASVAQTMWAIDAEEKVVGLPTGYTTAYLNGSQNRTNVLGTNMNPIVENIVDLDPDVVLAANIISEDDVQTLRENGLTVVYFEGASSIVDVTAKTRLTGQLVGACAEAAAVSDEMNATVQEVRASAADGENPTVYYAMGGGWTAGPDTFIGDVIATAGGDNIAAAADIPTYGEISEEVIAAEDPDWIVMPEGGELRDSAAIEATTAVQNDQIIRVNANFISQPGPRVTGPLVTLSEAFNPDSSAATPTETTEDEETTTESDDTTAGVTTTDQPTTEAGDGFGPGFGPVAALLALAASGLLAHRR
ncbi:PGF-CTERM-anchored ABC transporter substrate-binding protein [Halapricum hydrolyticum]|uniref:PGF-CTERM-anchored ABC transporter substrate-binding protein n=1 Tax=Halapricum hydrolyticum TaxID=2979991 RepID=A0AAE3IC82_9EURY|nr:PGF-CTERM-anchored ABC transporter substrate-binding protein [Halapricum hydrolyticum]MCU4718489.1 PGF-CTERM-anchored ABC transporter substrate-binding protein [Halapricum hydrolyticum]MCU4727492.1 PGF-CTERM-anchored ABC transporter substrate-binding protein [Halapricum hydrolyticum]